MHQLYAAPGSGNCYKAHLVMSQLGIAYNTTWVDVLAGETRDDWFLTLNPQGTVPFLRVEGGACIAESNAMLWYLAKGSSLFPVSAFEEAMALQWMIFEQTMLAPNLSPARFFTSILPEKRMEKADDIANWQSQGQAGLIRLDQHLQGQDFVASDRYTIADIAIYGHAHVADEAGLDLSAFPAVRRWHQRVQQSKGYVEMPTFSAVAA